MGDFYTIAVRSTVQPRHEKWPKIDFVKNLSAADLRPLNMVGTGLRRLAHNNGKACSWWKRRERLPIHIFRQNRSEFPLAWLMKPSAIFYCSLSRSIFVS